LFVAAENELNFYKTLPDRWIEKAKNYKMAFTSLLQSVGIKRRGLQTTDGSDDDDEDYVSNAEGKLYSMDLGYDYTEVNGVFTDGKGSFLNVVTNDVQSLVK
jgi:hypothetical protein